MKMNFFRVAAIAFAGMAMFSSCIDKDYDLSDIDTTARFDVKKLTVPINVDEITLDNIIDLEEDGAVKIVDDQYAIVQSGTIDAEQISVDAVHADAPVIEPCDKQIKAITHEGVINGALPGEAFDFDILSDKRDCSYSTNNVSDYIVAFESCKCAVTLDVYISLLELNAGTSTLSCKNLVFQLPKGLVLLDNDGGTYNAETGEIAFASKQSAGGKLHIHLVASGLDFTKMTYEYDYPTHHLEINENVYLKSGRATVSAKSGSGVEIPAALTLRTEFKLSDIDIKAFTGVIRYDVTDVNIPEIDLGDIPEVLTQEGTDISIVNPQIYLQITNPLQDYNLKAQTGVSLTAIRSNAPEKTYTLDAENPNIIIETNGASPVYNYCLSPKMPEKVDADYAGAQHVGFKSLSNVLSGNGMPRNIRVDLIEPCVPNQHVNDFPLGIELGNIGGNYKFFAPLDFKADSKVIYTDRTDGWGDEELDNLVIKELEVSMIVNSEVPVEVEISGFPIDRDGNQIGNVEITKAIINPLAKDQKIKLEITGEIRNLDGIEYHAVATSADPSKPLSPSMHINLTKIRPVVSGYYEKEL